MYTVVVFITTSLISMTEAKDYNADEGLKTRKQLAELRKMISTYVYKNKDSIDGTSIMQFVLDGKAQKPDVFNDPKELHPKYLEKYLNEARIQTLGNGSNVRSGKRYAHDFLSITGELFPEEKTKENITKIFNKIKKKRNETRRYFYHKDHESATQAFEFDEDVAQTIKQFMLQSVYQVRFDLQRTLVYRKKYKDDHSYNIAQLHAVLQESLYKIRALHTSCMNMQKLKKIHFLPYLVTYEKSLQAHTDINYYVKRVLDLHEKFILNLQGDA